MIQITQIIMVRCFLTIKEINKLYNKLGTHQFKNMEKLIIILKCLIKQIIINLK